MTGSVVDAAFLELYIQGANNNSFLSEWQTSWSTQYAGMVWVNDSGWHDFFLAACQQAMQTGGALGVYGQGSRVDGAALFAALDECTES